LVVSIIIGLGIVLAGAALAVSGARRLKQPRATADVTWERRHPHRAAVMTPWPWRPRWLTWDREGALVSLLGGALLLLTGTAVLGSAF
jgi:hypothetical protein